MLETPNPNRTQYKLNTRYTAPNGFVYEMITGERALAEGRMTIQPFSFKTGDYVLYSETSKTWATFGNFEHVHGSIAMLCFIRHEQVRR